MVSTLRHSGTTPNLTLPNISNSLIRPLRHAAILTDIYMADYLIEEDLLGSIGIRADL
jgi:hypothetical protein